MGRTTGGIKINSCEDHGRACRLLFTCVTIGFNSSQPQDQEATTLNSGVRPLGRAHERLAVRNGVGFTGQTSGPKIAALQARKLMKTVFAAYQVSALTLPLRVSSVLQYFESNLYKPAAIGQSTNLCVSHHVCEGRCSRICVSGRLFHWPGHLQCLLSPACEITRP